MGATWVKATYVQFIGPISATFKTITTFHDTVWVIRILVIWLINIILIELGRIIPDMQQITKVFSFHILWNLNLPNNLPQKKTRLSMAFGRGAAPGTGTTFLGRGLRKCIMSPIWVVKWPKILDASGLEPKRATCRQFVCNKGLVILKNFLPAWNII